MTGLDDLDTGEDGARLLDELHGAFVRYVVFPCPEAADSVVLWVAASHAQPAWEHAPRLAAISPQKRCGKSRLLDVVAETCHNRLITVNATVAAVARSIGEDPPTLLVDEADTLFGTTRQAENNEDLRGILNAGHQRNRPMSRWDMTARKLEQLETFAFAMLASIGDLPDTVMDRAVVVRMRRRGPGEQVSPYRTRRDSPPLRELRDRLADWVRARLDELRDAVPDMPLEDREADTWEPLVAVADLAGGDWPARARKAAEALTDGGRDDTDASMDVRLLTDLRTVFSATADLYGEPADRMDTKTLIERLVGLDESPWADVDGRGKKLDPRGLADRLRPYGVRPKVIRTGAKTTPRGYERGDLADAWTRYLPPAATAATTQHPQVIPVADEIVLQQQDRVLLQHETTRNGLTSQVAPVASVADPPPEMDGAMYDDPDESDTE